MHQVLSWCCCGCMHWTMLSFPIASLHFVVRIQFLPDYLKFSYYFVFHFFRIPKSGIPDHFSAKISYTLKTGTKHTPGALLLVKLTL